MSKPVFAYWSTRGIGEPIRMMLEHAGVEYEDKYYVCGDGPVYDDTCWTDVKEQLGMDFPNLPYYIDGELRLSESWAIMKYLARKNNMLPDKDHHLADMLEGVVTDLRKVFTAFCYASDSTEKFNAFFKTSFPEKMARFEKHLTLYQWVGGDKLTYVDFALCEILDHMRMVRPGCFDKYPKVAAYIEKFFNLSKIKAYRQTQRYKSCPVHNKNAKWGATA